PYFHPVAQAVKELDGKRAEVAVLHLLLTVGQRGHQSIALFLQVFVAGTGVKQSDCGEIVAAGKVPAQFAIGLFPPSQRLRRRRKRGGHRKRVRQPVHGNGMHITAIGFLRFLAGSGEETDLLHGERKRLPLDSLAARGLVVENRVLEHSSAKRIRKKSGTSERARGGNELPARESVETGHDFPSLKFFPTSRPYNRFNLETWHCRGPRRTVF